MGERDDWNGNTGAIILFAQNAIKPQFFTKPNAICVRKIITVMISCSPKISLWSEDSQGLTPKWLKLRGDHLQEQQWVLAERELNW